MTDIFDEDTRWVCVRHRCTEHYDVPAQNTNEASGSECGGCIAAERDNWEQRAMNAAAARSLALGDGEVYRVAARDIIARLVSAIRDTSAMGDCEEWDCVLDAERFLDRTAPQTVLPVRPTQAQAFWRRAPRKA